MQISIRSLADGADNYQRVSAHPSSHESVAQGKDHTFEKLQDPLQTLIGLEKPKLRLNRRSARSGLNRKPPESGVLSKVALYVTKGHLLSIQTRVAQTTYLHY